MQAHYANPGITCGLSTLWHNRNTAFPNGPRSVNTSLLPGGQQKISTLCKYTSEFKGTALPLASPSFVWHAQIWIWGDGGESQLQQIKQILGYQTVNPNRTSKTFHFNLYMWLFGVFNLWLTCKISALISKYGVYSYQNSVEWLSPVWGRCLVGVGEWGPRCVRTNHAPHPHEVPWGP